MTSKTTELALQEFDVEQLEDLDAMDWGTSFATSLGAGAAVSAAISIAALT
ncbi:hypothetical protein [Williamsia herbipolensis]|uniref:Class IIb bacteriocin, lactobin A/cerein 7B family n=1 Tax=Williamsia herbipolensis TaxID=1603258 RepID=A0AAU4K0Y5_9NOCA|nr:hypothetical protein [Williamsia herbipolensis]MCX6467794.1 hypothetical protein [Mycobacteriales bacterium]